jgi:hypothetical protein
MERVYICSYRPRHKCDSDFDKWNYMDYDNIRNHNFCIWSRVVPTVIPMVSGRSRDKYDSDIAKWNYVDWQRTTYILRFWTFSSMEWFLMVSVRFRHKYDIDVD